MARKTARGGKYVNFKGRMIMVGFGSIGQGVLPLILRHIGIKPSQITIIADEMRGGIPEAKRYGVEFIEKRLTRANYRSVLAGRLDKGDFLVNLSVEVASTALVELCQEKGALYIDTCIEPWPGGYTDPNLSVSRRSNYALRDAMLKLKPRYRGGPTAVIAHGANPGLVSHFVKQALVNIARDTGVKVKTPTTRDGWGRLARRLGVKVIHIAERDTQRAKQPKPARVFVNTWSVEGFYEEGVAPAELGWGTHEKSLPVNAYEHPTGPRNQIAIAQPGATTWVRSWVPHFEIQGMVIRHGEAFTISDHLTVWNGEKALYRPTVHYAYCPSNEAIVSMRELEMLNWKLHTNQRIMNDEITDGDDRLGVLLMGHPYRSWWTGSLLSIEESRRLIPGQSATTVQVSSAVYAAVAWAMKNPSRGLLVPDELPWREVLAYAEKYWGGIHSEAADWDPLMNRKDLFEGWNNKKVDSNDPWQFSNFLV